MRLLFFHTLLLSCMLFLSCQKKQPVQPEQNQPEVAYNLYVGNEGSRGEVYIVNPDSGNIIHTVQGLEGSFSGLAVSHDGKKLYVPTIRGKIYTVDVQSTATSVIWEGDPAVVYIAPDGTVIMISIPGSNDVRLGTIDPFSDKISVLDTLDLRLGVRNNQIITFDPKRPILYAVNKNDHLFSYNYASQQLVKVYENIFIIYRMLISPDGRFLYAAGGPVVDLERGEVIAAVGGNPGGSLAISPDGKRLYITDPARYRNIRFIPTGKVYVYDTQTYRYIDEIDFLDEQGRPYFTDQIVLHPDRDIAYVSNWGRLVFEVDLRTKTIIKAIKVPRVSPLAFGVKP